MIEMEEHGDGWVLIMRDVSDAVLAEGRVLSRAENRRVLQAIDALHAEFMGEDVPGVPLQLIASVDAATVGRRSRPSTRRYPD